MIKVGTICYLIEPHGAAGMCCTVIGPLTQAVLHNSNGDTLFADGYPIELCDGRRTGYKSLPLMAVPAELIPIAPPGLTENDDKRVKEPA